MHLFGLNPIKLSIFSHGAPIQTADAATRTHCGHIHHRPPRTTVDMASGAVSGLVVGNEVLLSGTLSLNQLVDYLQRGRALAQPYNVPVTYADIAQVSEILREPGQSQHGDYLVIMMAR